MPTTAGGLRICNYSIEKVALRIPRPQLREYSTTAGRITKYIYVESWRNKEMPTTAGALRICNHSIKKTGP